MKIIQGHRQMRLYPDRVLRRKECVLVSLLLFSLSARTPCLAQNPSLVKGAGADPIPVSDIFRLEHVAVEGGAELITIHARLDGLGASEGEWVPLVTVLRDTLGDQNPENDRLRYVWPLTYTRPTMRQRVLGAIPFLYTRVGNKKPFSEKEPPPILDLASPDRDVWNRIFWTALQNIFLYPYGTPVKASSRSYQQNLADYRKSHIVRALSVLSLYQSVEGLPTFSESERAEIEARLRLTDKALGGLVDELNLQRYNKKQLLQTRDERGHNWELLRQRAEAESLFFEPLQMPDGSATHVLLWVAKPELLTNQGRRYDSRFLNISSPWSDKRLLSWQGYSEMQFFDSESQPASPDIRGARATEMIPLALYGLDNPKIPMLLVDFRDGFNPKRREMSRRVLQDITRNVLSLSRFGDLPYFLGRSVLDFVTGRRGMDVNQPSRLHTYSQLKLLLSLNRSIEPKLRTQIGNRLEKVSLNPLENDLQAEPKLATAQYEALMAYAKRPDGLPQKLNRDRRAELASSEHGRVEQVLFRAANILSFGKYTHREKDVPELEAKLDLARSLAYHTRFLREVSQSSPQIEVAWNLEDVKRSLVFIAEHGARADSRAVSATAKIFAHTEDGETRRACLESLSRIDNAKARNELIRISEDKDLDRAWKDLARDYINTPRRVEPLPAPSKSAVGGAGRQ